MDGDRQQTIDEFEDAVNMTRKELEEWLQTDETKSVGQSDGDESKGHESVGMVCRHRVGLDGAAGAH